jgi:hypothetical protein
LILLLFGVNKKRKEKSTKMMIQLGEREREMGERESGEREREREE